MAEDSAQIVDLGDGVYLATAPIHVDAAVIDGMLDQIWSLPAWAQPWGLVVDVNGAESYHPDVRKTGVPAKHLRAVGTAIVTRKSMHHVLIPTIGLGLRTLMGFDLSAHEQLEDAVERMRGSVAKCRELGRLY